MNEKKMFHMRWTRASESFDVLNTVSMSVRHAVLSLSLFYSNSCRFFLCVFRRILDCAHYFMIILNYFTLWPLFLEFEIFNDRLNKALWTFFTLSILLYYLRFKCANETKKTNSTIFSHFYFKNWKSKIFRMKNIPRLRNDANDKIVNFINIIKIISLNAIFLIKPNKKCCVH